MKLEDLNRFVMLLDELQVSQLSQLEVRTKKPVQVLFHALSSL